MLDDTYMVNRGKGFHVLASTFFVEFEEHSVFAKTEVVWKVVDDFEEGGGEEGVGDTLSEKQFRNGLAALLQGQYLESVFFFGEGVDVDQGPVF